MNKEHVLSMINLIDVCAKRGAFEGSELGRVATLRGYLEAEIQEKDQPQDKPTANEL